MVRDTRAGRCDRTERKLVLPSKSALLRNVFNFRGHTHREHRQDDGTLRHKNHPTLRGSDGQEDIQGHGQPDGDQNDVTEQANGTKGKNCQKKQTLIMSKLVNDNGTWNNHNQRKRGGHYSDRSRMNNAAGNVRCVQRIRLRHPQGNPCHLQEYGVIGKQHHALRQAGQLDKL